MTDDLVVKLQATLGAVYRLEHELGRGGMATVYLAHDLKHDRRVALKVLHPELAQTVGPDRFAREIRLAARLQHPHILSVHDSGDTGTGQLWFTMPYVDGESLRDRLRREGQLPLDDALRITREAAQALQYAHEQGVVHRDIKPENLLLTKDGSTLVADFGVARALGASESLTQTGMAVGTPAYMSPEQATGEAAIDARTDVYALGCVLYEMLAGEPPFTGPNAQAIIAKRFSTMPTPLRVVRPDVPEAVESAVTRALARVRADRFASTAELGRALQPAAITPAGTPTVIVPKPHRRGLSRRAAALLGGAGALGAVSLAAFLLRPQPAHRPMAARQFTYSGMATGPALAPDGRSVAYVSGGRSLVVQRLDGGEPVTLVPATRAVFSARWSADGRTVVFVMMRDSTELMATYAVPATGGAARKILEDQLPLDTGPDSTTIVRVPRERHRIEVIEWRSGRTLRAVPLPAGTGDGIASVYWSPNRRLFAIEDGGSVWVVPDSGAPTLLTTGWNPRWAPGSDAVYVLRGPPGAEALLRIRVNPRSGASSGQPVRLASLPGISGFDVSGDRLVYTLASTSLQARALRLEGRPTRIVDDRLLTSGTAPVSNVAITPDGRTVAYSQIRGGDENVYTVTFEGGSPRAVASTTSAEGAPAFSPDGARIAYVQSDSSGRTIMVADLQSGTRERVGSLPLSGFVSALYSVVRARWSADGTLLTYPARDLRHIAVVDVSQGTERRIVVPDSLGTTYGEAVPAPDGRSLAVSTLRRMTDWGEVWVASSDGTGWVRARTPFGENQPVAWTADGWIYYENHRAIMTDYGPVRVELWRSRGFHRAPELVVALPEGCGQTDVSADGRRVACVNGRTESDIFLASDFDPELARR